MTVLHQWLLHRQRLLGITSDEQLARAAGLSPDSVHEVMASGSLSALGRGARGWLARALKVSLRDLEALDAGEEHWIPDERIVDVEQPRHTPVLRHGDSAPGTWLPCVDGRGIPIVGQIARDGVVAYADDAAVEEHLRLPVRYRGQAHAFALRIESDARNETVESFAVLQSILPRELEDSVIAAVTASDGAPEGRSFFGHISIAPDGSVEVATMLREAKTYQLPLELIVRAARLLAMWPSMNASHGAGETLTAATPRA